ncbi:VanZ family protein [Enterococcus asini]|uniref:VanZ family protein n=1 Tax=Enterococcus asini TaxID=57732 RepID=UPI0028926F00|nr:VanZ family protein [Enterococcus asini]MDT2756168.1 VanZ family protein [Enterococcus asini]
MSAYTTPILTALFLFPFLAALAIVPYGIWQYRKYGSVSKGKLLILFSFSFYLLCAYFLVILPLPDPHEVAKLTTIRYNLVPFTALRGFLHETVLQPTNPSTYLPALKQNAFLQPFFNLMLTLPFGFYLRYIWNLSLKKVIMASFFLSLFFELTQLSGLYFIYPRSYRLFDVDDLILNTSGGLLGYLLTPVLTWLLPSMEKLNVEAIKKRDKASFSRRFLALMVDSILFNLIFEIVALFVPQFSLENYGIYLIGIFFYFVVVPYFWQGATIGKHLVKIRMEKVDGRKAGFGALIFRQFLLFGVSISTLRFLLPVVLLEMQRDQGRHLEFYLLVLGAIALFLLFFLINVLFLLFNKNQRMFYERMTGLKEVGF